MGSELVTLVYKVQINIHTVILFIIMVQTRAWFHARTWLMIKQFAASCCLSGPHLAVYTMFISYAQDDLTSRPWELWSLVSTIYSSKLPTVELGDQLSELNIKCLINNISFYLPYVKISFKFAYLGVGILNHTCHCS